MKKFNVLASYPQNFIIRNPLYGSLILLLFTMFFLVIYQPMNTERSQFFSFEITMGLYAVASSVSAYICIRLLKLLGPFSDPKRWSLVKEIIFIYLVLQIIGIAIYFSAFVIEETTWEARWNFHTFIDSCKYSFFIEVFPFAFFTFMNYRHLMGGEAVSYRQSQSDLEEVVNIVSKLKRESLSFRSDELLFVCSDGNYVEFFLWQEQKLKKIPIRNSISDVEQQLAGFPIFFRSHRAYIVNLNKVQTKKGNTLGYRLTLAHCQMEVPVSRQHVKTFDRLFQ